ncbi:MULTISPECIES: class I SAM-dependent methyltransferase [unclassified Lentimonas]|uniref:class I SAM-dependent methyltransferase n=1 Tax=unclassified Lentimonas TaxID=2630993 RepID=UPI001323D66C|nr:MULTISPECIES: class I SAM-dependent methyltransferase [unclassified Lentimonas]CAA6679197.1 Unannotated [Lentimonas sp. CC4]CAA6684059.1 Unannotated [Lentimonas sp. CC6]CAA7076565.1 Unannotated [Lentimonas sp. CC4]CAA7171661.1 Unannotated [Lentimonas sp. CC21]CAA7183038.1 Unannotated [Lentimonas sp. CC8]
MIRCVTPEILDSLEPEHPDAIGSRRDLRIINRLMGNRSWLLRQVAQLTDSRRYLEIGAGQGALAKDLITRLSLTRYTALDFAPQPDDWPATAHWVQGDLLSADCFQDADVLIASLILHHFTDDQLGVIGKRIEDSSVQTMLVCEPCRRGLHKLQLAAGRLIGFNHVTLHDGAVSIDAGFRRAELPQLLGLNPKAWQLSIEENWMGAYRMSASRI